MHKSVGVVDYGAGNILNVLRAFEKHQVTTKLVSDPSELSEHSHIVLPGVGSFDYGMKNLNQRHLSEALIDRVQAGIPLLGICLGMQLLASRGHENGEMPGLGLIEGDIIHLSQGVDETSDIRAPHTGWSALEWRAQAHESPKSQLRAAYFNHSYYLHSEADGDVVATASIGTMTIPAAVKSGAILATQFHPEKSGEAGLALLREWLHETSG